jgi:hypothetical protein
MSAYRWTVIGGEGATNYDWYVRDVSLGAPFGSPENTHHSYFNQFGNGSCDVMEIKVEATNGCNVGSPVSYQFDSDDCMPYDIEGCEGFLLKKQAPAQTLLSGGIEDVAQLSVFPNPVTSVINILVPAGSFNIKQTTITLTDGLGRTVKKVTAVGQANQLNIAGFAKGVYLIQIADNKKRVIKRVMKM